MPTKAKRPVKKSVKKTAAIAKAKVEEAVANSKDLDQRMVRTTDKTIKHHPDNPRVGDVESIKASIDANGFLAPIVIQSSTGYIVAGNHRWRAAKDLGLDMVPAIFADITEQQARSFMLADNSSSDKATYNEQVLAKLLGDFEEDFGIDALAGTGYSKNEADKIRVRAEWQDEEEFAIEEEGVARTGQEATNTFKLAQPKERVSDLEELARRSLILSIPVKKHEMFRNAMAAIREEFDANSNEEALVSLFKQGGFLPEDYYLFPQKEKKAKKGKKGKKDGQTN